MLARSDSTEEKDVAHVEWPAQEVSLVRRKKKHPGLLHEAAAA